MTKKRLNCCLQAQLTFHWTQTKLNYQNCIHTRLLVINNSLFWSDFSKECENAEEWLQTLICCCFESSFDVKAVSISCFLDLVNVVITVEQNSQSSTNSIACIVPLITKENLRWIENSNVYEVSCFNSICFAFNQCINNFIDSNKSVDYFIKSVHVQSEKRALQEGRYSNLWSHFLMKSRKLQLTILLIVICVSACFFFITTCQ